MTVQTISMEQQYREILKSFPEVGLLVEDLYLINPETGRRYLEAEPQPLSERDIEKLRRIVVSLFNPNRIYTPQQILSILETELKVSEERAERGLKMMIGTGFLTMFFNNGIRVGDNVIM